MIDEPTETNEFANAKRRAAKALLSSIEEHAKRPLTGPELHDLAASYHNVVDPPMPDAEIIIEEIGTTLEDAPMNHVAALEHFYDCVRFDCHLPPRIGPVTYEDVAQCLDAARSRYNTVNAELLGANLSNDDFRHFAKGVKEIVGYHDDTTMNDAYNLQAALGSVRETRRHLEDRRQEASRLRSSLNDVYRTARDGQVTDLSCRVQARVAALAKSDKAIQEFLDAQHTPKAETTSARVVNEFNRLQSVIRQQNEALAESAGATATITNLRNELQAANEENAEREAEFKAICVALQEAIKPTGLDVNVDSYIRCKDAIRALAVRAEGLKLVQDALSGVAGIDVTLHPNLVVRRLIDKLAKTQATADELASAAAKLQITTDQAHDVLDQIFGKPRHPNDTLVERIQTLGMRSERYHVDLSAVQDELVAVMKALGLHDKTADQVGDAARIVAERDRLRGTILEIQDAIASAIADPNRPPITGSKSDLARAVAAAIAQSQAMAKELAATKGMLRVANSQLVAAHGALLNALSLQQGLPDALGPFMQAAAKIIAFWRRGDESYQLAAKELEKALETTIGESWARFNAIKATELGVVLSATKA